MAYEKKKIIGIYLDLEFRNETLNVQFLRSQMAKIIKFFLLQRTISG